MDEGEWTRENGRVKRSGRAGKNGRGRNRRGENRRGKNRGMDKNKEVRMRGKNRGIDKN